jgi:DNA-binding CsgD family transcriptional regulator
VNARRRRRVERAAEPEFRVHPRKFVFFDCVTGTRRFEVNADADGRVPVEEATSLLAMQCVVRGRAPSDFLVMVAPAEDLIEGLMSRTKKLIQACMATSLPIQISSRQQDVLHGVLQNLSNKEIAARLNVAERTVKFHVSALLQKFHVPDRVGLMQKAGDLISGGANATWGGYRSQLRRETPEFSREMRPSLVRIAQSEGRTR